MSITIQVSGRSSILKADYYPPIELTGLWEIALTNFSTYNSIANINEKNNIFYYDDKQIILPPGAYEIEDIETFLQTQLNEEGAITLTGNRNTLKAEINCKYEIDFTKPNNLPQV